MNQTTPVDRLFECAYCGSLIRSRIVPVKCDTCGKSSFLIHDPDSKDSKEDIVDYYKNKKEN
jgi:Zn finger protein HypA/HybF involved in hydrogenase expression